MSQSLRMLPDRSAGAAASPSATTSAGTSDDGDQSTMTMEERLQNYREKKRQEMEAKALKSRRQQRRPRWSSTSSATSTSGGGGSRGSCRYSGDGSVYSRQSVGSIRSRNSSRGNRSSAGSALGSRSSLDRFDRFSPASTSFAGTGTRAHAVSIGSRVPPRPGMITPSSRRAKGRGKAGSGKLRSSGSFPGRTSGREPLSEIQCSRKSVTKAKRGSSGSATATKSNNTRDPTMHSAKSEVRDMDQTTVHSNTQYTLPLAGQFSVSPLSSPEDELDVDDESEFHGRSFQIPVISSGSRARTDGENNPHGDSTVTSVPVSKLPTSSSCRENDSSAFNIDPADGYESDDNNHSSGLFFCDESDDGDSENIMKTKKDTSRKKNRRKTTLFMRPPPDLEQEEEDSPASEVPASPKASDEAVVEVEEANNDEEMKARPVADDDIDQALQASDCERLAGLCNVYRDEHAALRFLIGILKLEKGDAEERMKTLSEAYEAKLVQSRSTSAELTALRKENASLRNSAAEKEEMTEKMISTLQTQMATGLSAAIQKTKALQMQLDAANIERERLEKQLAETNSE